MNLTITRQNISIGLAIMIAAGLLAQYVLLVPFPLGHEYPSYINRTQAVLAEKSLVPGVQTLLTNSRYPGTIGLLLASNLVPVSWPTRMIWLTMLAHMLVALALGRLAFTIGGWPASVAAIVVGSAIATALRHDINGWFAHLWSLPPFLMFLASTVQQKRGAALGWLLTSFIFHPLSGFVGLVIAFLTLPVISAPRRRNFVYGVGIIIGLSILWFIRHNYVLWRVGYGSLPYSLSELFKQSVAPLLVLAPIGLVVILHRYKTDRTLVVTILAYTWLSIFLVFNRFVLDGDLLSFRFEVYLLLAIALLASLGFPQILTLTQLPQRYRVVAAATIATIFIAVTGSANAAWYQAHQVTYELAILQPDERAAVDWLNNNLSADAHILTPPYGAYRWASIMTNIKVTELSPPDPSNSSADQLSSQLVKQLQKQEFTHLLIFSQRDQALAATAAKIPSAHLRYKNREAVIYSVEAL